MDISTTTRQIEKLRATIKDDERHLIDAQHAEKKQKEEIEKLKREREKKEQEMQKELRDALKKYDDDIKKKEASLAIVAGTIDRFKREFDDHAHDIKNLEGELAKLSRAVDGKHH